MAARDESVGAAAQYDHQRQRQHRTTKQDRAAEPTESRAQRFAIARRIGAGPAAAAYRRRPRLRLRARAVAHHAWGALRLCVHRSHEASSMIQRTSALKLIFR